LYGVVDEKGLADVHGVADVEGVAEDVTGLAEGPASPS
jgi:hypothetical protein